MPYIFIFIIYISCNLKIFFMENVLYIMWYKILFQILMRVICNKIQKFLVQGYKKDYKLKQLFKIF